MGFLDKALDIAAPGTGSLIEGATEGLDILLGRYGEDAYREAARIQTELLNQGVQFYSESPRYYYTKLADLKIQMISKATQDARLRAEKIAERLLYEKQSQVVN